MKRNILMTALIMAMAHISFAQSIESSMKFWDEGRLTWDDFNKRNTDGYEKSNISTSFYRYTDTQKYGNLKVIRTKLRTALNKESTWVRTEYISDKLLRYNQLVFDMAEATRQEMQNEIDVNLGKYSYEEILKFYRDKYNVKLQELREETMEGDREDIILKYEQEVAGQLAKETEDSVPEFDLNNWGYSYHIGFRSAFMTGKSSMYLKPTYGISLGFDITYRRSMLSLYMGVGSGKIGADMDMIATIDGRETEVTWARGKKYSSMETDLIYGYSVIDNGFMRLAPIIGIGMNNLSHKTDSETNTSMTGMHLLGGVDINWKLLRTASITYTPWWGGRTYGETSLKTRIFVARSNLMQGFNPYSINLAIAFDLYGRGMK